MKNGQDLQEHMFFQEYVASFLQIVKIYVDIDDTICTSNKGLDYSKAEPIKSNIEYDNVNLISFGVSVVTKPLM